MCGIAGMVYDDIAAPVDPDRLLEMCRTLSHRGPDDEGMYVTENAGLAVRRLAIVDVPAGRQPVCDEDRTIHAVLNGEIYNHRKLRDELARRGHRFRSSTDSEVIPHLYEEYGPDFVKRLEGMFAIALWDEVRQQLILCRDRAGIKPLYYALPRHGVVFGSEMRAVLAAGVSTTVDLQALSNYFSLMYVPGPGSIYREIRRLPPATVMVWRPDGYRIRRYWDLRETSRRHDLSPRRAEAKLRELLADSVDQQLSADVPLGFFLSGGIDSSSVVAMASQLRPDETLRTFTVGFADRSYDERREAALLARHLGTSHLEVVVEPRAEDVVDRISPIFDEPFADPSIVPTYYLCELARRHVTVALSGDGGDELFAGYHTYKADKLARYYRLLPRPVVERFAPALLRFMPASHRRASFDFKARRFVENALEQPGRSHYLWRVVFREGQKARLLQPDLYAELSDSYETHEQHHLAGVRFDRLTRFQYTDANVYLVDNVLTKIDRLSMAHSLEVRVPLLTTPLIEFAFSLPGRVKMPRYRTKRLLRNAMAAALPRRITAMGKRGFNAPLPRWLTEQFRPLVDEYLSREVLRRHGYLRPEEVEQWVDRHMNRTGEHSREIWSLLMFSLWVEEHKAYR
ncbi:asparagine synthase (glutamine-hydrolysing) [Micromonospora rhizosphaerae]|uniref:asparagine synthase (glutamine-hydrolyzing) n=1 Tax=Micromonospora rhizosphaerae TaxID=568872 RepID=A0A1C6SMQ7_9ACTN|nr:asparagine synthase (glutamine-hydrolyzing) [Micromonospora rhizosphaerae]SCL30718.1 asparagine synthase (glutamine-hydrolysing) [Micromonospora rhizosphaerae]